MMCLNPKFHCGHNFVIFPWATIHNIDFYLSNKNFDDILWKVSSFQKSINIGSTVLNLWQLKESPSTHTPWSAQVIETHTQAPDVSPALCQSEWPPASSGAAPLCRGWHTQARLQGVDSECNYYVNAWLSLLQNNNTTVCILAFLLKSVSVIYLRDQ